MSRISTTIKARYSYLRIHPCSPQLWIYPYIESAGHPKCMHSDLFGAFNTTTASYGNSRRA